MAEISVGALRLFGDERWSRGKKNRSTGDNNDESVHASVRRMRGRRRAGDRMPRVFPPTCDRGGLSLRRLARLRIPFFLYGADRLDDRPFIPRNCFRADRRAKSRFDRVAKRTATVLTVANWIMSIFQDSANFIN